MRRRTQEERILDMIKRPVPRKRVGIVHLEMVRESRTLYGMKRFQNPREAAEMVRPLCEKADREMVLVLSLNGRLEPQAVEIAAVGGIFATLSSDEFKKTAAAKKNLCGCRSNWRLEAKKSPVVPGK